jgi:glyoxylase-like metal-dependent hydrolase (beta-lactamase superfamily II)
VAIFQTTRFKLTTLEFGNFKLDGGAMFGVIPRTLWGRYHPPDELNRIEMALRCLLVETGDRKILVDTGFGEGRSARFKEIYAFTGSESYLDLSLSEIGLARTDITDVFLTHLHFDHVGGSTINKPTKPEPTFPNARYHIQLRQLEHGRSRLERDKASYFPEDFEPLVERGVVEFYDGEFTLLPGIDTIICNGHSPAMQLMRVRDDGETYVYAADLIPLSSQFPLPWIMAYDLFPVTTLEEKRRILAQASDEGWVFIFEHDARIISGKVIRTEKGFTLAQ